mmetsp:Transcript_20495/g.30427  ORF Transcript_20495/g.30427 Transcript_20495/m.30427 type:complete len:300 (+) Transcript_20495:165-1064(+)|eukprot:CAMPEP_0194215894 /NCGR_PEP_ID=MMETSP0156-20130528/17996_1 /TAXON_ID=33649 /ORGANISM="Thalassionema nitzschioides, Strain L26-B" /LENGTH=299 /DNA_ID=CAMNT_0038944531 /DNA_START=94 /DNA_END=993 /DNA_ORIENTATION=+
MRRRNNQDQCRNHAARNFYKQHEATQCDIGKNTSSKASNSDGKPFRHYEPKTHQTSLSFSVVGFARMVINFARSILASIQAAAHFFYNTTLKSNVDRLDYCVSCSRKFLRLGRIRKSCANCENEFCSTCLQHQHRTFDGRQMGQDIPKPVCQYCFFTLCARHCEAKCCTDLPTKDLLSFLARKGISSKTALEKPDLVRLIHAWSLDLDQAAAILNLAADLESGACDFHGSMKQQASYSATSAHLTLNAMDLDSGSSSIAYDYYKLTVVELRHLLQKRELDISHCVEKSDLISMLVQSEG